jgi:hypothetical protein
VIDTYLKVSEMSRISELVYILAMQRDFIYKVHSRKRTGKYYRGESTGVEE